MIFKKEALGRRNQALLWCYGCFFSAEAHLRLFDTHRGIRINGAGQKGIGSDDHVVADLCRTAQQRGSGVNRHVVTHLRVAALTGNTLHARRRKGAQRHALIDFDMVADDARLAHYDACTMVDEEILANGGAGVDVDTRTRMGVLSHDTRDHRHVADIKLMGDPIDEYGKKAGIGQHNLLPVVRRGIALKKRLQILL